VDFARAVLLLSGGNAAVFVVGGNQGAPRLCWQRGGRLRDGRGRGRFGSPGALSGTAGYTPAEVDWYGREVPMVEEER
jgi:hypothetical protein